MSGPGIDSGTFYLVLSTLPIDHNGTEINWEYIWRLPSELTPMTFNTGLTHLVSEASIYVYILAKKQ